jgi:hypothetical protein
MPNAKERAQLPQPFIPTTLSLRFAAFVMHEYLYNSGHFRCTVDVTLRTQVHDTTAATAETEWQKVRAILGWDELAARLSDLSDFHCWIVIRDQGERSDETETHQDRTYSFTVICMANDNS